MHYEVLIVLGKNWRAYPPQRMSGDNRKLQLSIESRLSTLAAGFLYRANVAPLLVIASGHTAGLAWPSEAAAMRDYLFKRFPDIPGSAVQLDEQSLDTPGNAEHVARFLTQWKTQKVALLTVSFHVPRSKRLFGEFGVKVAHSFSAEEEFAKYAPQYRTFLKNYRRSPRVIIEIMKEWCLRSLLIVDPRGTIPKILTHRIRG
ncbi:MAG: YdcF family protein [Nitrospira sp.]|nr:YdcF family protein [Nitrospira sp.]